MHPAVKYLYYVRYRYTLRNSDRTVYVLCEYGAVSDLMHLSYRYTWRHDEYIKVSINTTWHNIVAEHF